MKIRSNRNSQHTFSVDGQDDSKLLPDIEKRGNTASQNNRQSAVKRNNFDVKEWKRNKIES